MNTTNLQRMITFLALMGSLVMYGCAQTGTSSKMDTSMDTMESSSQMMDDSGMKEPADMMDGKTMKKSMMEDETGSGMTEKENTMMENDKEMMKQE